MRTFIRAILLSLLGLSLLAIPGAFINQDFLHRQLDKVLKLKVRDTYKGGEKEFRFMDPLNDDNGNGNLVYPKNSQYTNRGQGLLDLVSVTLHKPQTEVDWGSDNIYWQFTYRFQNLATDPDSDQLFQNPVVNHYFGYMGLNEGRTDTLESRAELVQFNRNFPWQYVVSINGYDDYARIESYDGKYKDKITLMVDKASNSLIVRVPLDYKPLREVFKREGTYHYVLVGGYDSMAKANFVPIKKRAGLQSGGGKESSLTPRVYDYLTPEGTTQKNLLNSYNEEEFSFATLEPVLAVYGLKNEGDIEITQDMIDEFKIEADKEDSALALEYKEKLSELKMSHKGTDNYKEKVELGIAYLNTSDLDNAESFIVDCLEIFPDYAEALAYLGTIRALQGGRSESISESMELVYEAFDLYEKALSNVKTSEEELAVRLNRGNVALSVPESVFVKCLIGAEDFLRAAEIYKELSGENYSKIGDCYLKAALCFKEAGRIEESEIYFQAALDTPQLNASTKYELIKQGYI